MARKRRERRFPLGKWIFRSGFEKVIAEDMIEKKVDFAYEDKVIMYVVPAATRKYIPDFTLPNGIIVEAKGRWTLDDRKKIILVMEQNPKLDLRMLFQRDQVLNKGSKTKYSAWCDKRNIPYAVGKVIPSEWLSEGTEAQE
jgi:hypothetical protein